MKILSADQLREADNLTISGEPVASIDLMERASRQCFRWICERYNRFTSFYVLCGNGNNGGDGLALARMLHRAGRKVRVCITGEGKRSEDCELNLQRLKEHNVEIIKSEDFSAEAITAEEIIIDAIFGTGLNRPVEGITADIITSVNNTQNTIISIDIPSGLFCDDNRNNDMQRIIKADHTLTFTSPKKAFFLPSYGEFAGEWHVLEIGILPETLRRFNSSEFYVTPEVIGEVYQPRKKFSHKGSFGHVLIIAGSEGKAGAAVLCAKAAVKAGAGLTTVYCVERVAGIIHNNVPEAMVVVAGKEFPHTLPPLEKYNAIVCGPGIGTGEDAQGLLANLIRFATAPLILDADALNLISMNKTWLGFLPRGTVLTPHPLEFRRLFGDASTDEDALELLQSSALKYNSVIVRKGACTCTAMPDGNLFFNSTGNPGLAKGGSGDVLAGIIGALVAQGYTPSVAAVTGVYLHGLAADFALSNQSTETLTPTDVIRYLPDAWKSIPAPQV